MTCWAVIPIKASGDAKSRLSDVLDARQREALVSAMLERVVDAARASSAFSRIVLVGPGRGDISRDLAVIPDPGLGLNPAVQSALESFTSDSPGRIVFIAADLPTVEPGDLASLARVPENAIAIAPDRHKTGTNAISLPLPGAAGFQFAFGPDSFARHKHEAERLGLNIEIVESPGLERDIDEPEDLADAESTLGPVR